MSLYKVGDVWGIDYRDEYGRRHRKTVGSEAGARALEVRIKEQVNRSKKSVTTFMLGEGLTLEGARDLWIATLPVGQRRRHDLTRALGHAARKLGNIPAAQVTPKLLEEYAAVRSGELAPSSQAYENGILKSFFGWLAAQWYLPSNPASALNTKRPMRSAGLSISYADEATILRNCGRHNTQLKVLLALDAGLRAGEIVSLRREHWNREAQTLTVFASKTKTTRLIPLTRRLTLELEQGTTMPGAALVHARGNPHSATSFLSKVTHSKTPIRFHDLRHSFASRLAAVSKPHVVRTLMGHAPRSTTDLYLHPSLEELREAIHAMEQANPNLQLEPKPQPKERNDMPGKRYTFRVTGEHYGPLHGQRVRTAPDQTSNQPGHVTVEAQNLEGQYVVALKDLEIIPQASTRQPHEPERSEPCPDEDTSSE